ncbi:MAG TPA: hypothetical protein VK466_10770 [Terriglobales bacterium]|nr:hypothetical protein [Terriglobales bacterium]
MVRYLIRSEMQRNKDMEDAPDRTLKQPEIHDLPWLTTPAGTSASDIVRRPSGVAGSKYELVTKAYIVALHAALAGQQDAAKAVAELEKQLVTITGFHAGPPKHAY